MICARGRWLRCCIVSFFVFIMLSILPAFIEEIQIYHLEHTQIRRKSSIKVPNFHSTCNPNSDTRGFHQQVIAYSLYGDLTRPDLVRRYLDPLKDTIDIIYNHFPGWTVRIYHNMTADNTSWKVFENTFRSKGHVDLCNTTQIVESRTLGDVFAMTWRWLPLLDDRVDIFMSRDTDSVILPREVAAVHEWLESNQTFHVMRDHPNHCVPMLGGLWGVKVYLDRARVTRLGERIFQVNHFHDYDYDQKLLRRHVWPLARSNMIAHDSYCCELFQPSRPFPTPREGGNFVGMIGSPSDSDVKLPACPKRCRLKTTTHWRFC